MIECAATEETAQRQDILRLGLSSGTLYTQHTWGAATESYLSFSPLSEHVVKLHRDDIFPEGFCTFLVFCIRLHTRPMALWLLLG